MICVSCKGLVAIVGVGALAFMLCGEKNRRIDIVHVGRPCSESQALEGIHKVNCDPVINSQPASTQLIFAPYVLQSWSRHP